MDKAQKTNLINRRTVAYLIEITIVAVLLAPLQAFAGATLGWIATIGYLLCRDLLGPVSFGKRLVGLTVKTLDGGDMDVTAKLSRNVSLAIPFGGVIEFFVAFYGNDQMQRIGDKMAKTCVVDLEPDTKGQGSWSGQLLLTLIITFVTLVKIVPSIILALS